MINTILVEDDLYIQKHFVDRLAADGEFRLVGVFRDAFEAEKHCDATVKLVLMDVQTQHKHSGLAAAEQKGFSANQNRCGYLACRSRSFAKSQIRRSRQPVV